MNIQAVKQLVKNQSKRPILQCLHYEDDKIIVTNSYSLIIEKQINKVEKPFNIHTDNMKLYNGTYPDVSRIKPSNDILLDVNKIDKINDFYQIDHHSFDIKLVDTTFKCIDKKDIKILKIDLKVSIKEKSPCLIYETDDIYILILGIRT